MMVSSFCAYESLPLLQGAKAITQKNDEFNLEAMNEGFTKLEVSN